MEPSLAGLRLLRQVAEAHSFTAAAAELGYTQSGVSRQAAALEQVAGAKLFDRHPDGVGLTTAGRTLLRHAVVVLDAVDAAERELAGVPPSTRPVRLGMFVSAGAVLVPRVLAALRRRHPEVAVTTREGTTPALVRALRAGTLDAAVLTSRPPHGPLDAESPPIEVDPLAEQELLLAVPAAHPLAASSTVPYGALGGLAWIASSSSGQDPLLGVWPVLGGRPVIAHTVRDWLTKLELVAAGAGVTTVSSILAPVIPAGVRLLPVVGGPSVRRRLGLAFRPGSGQPGVDELAAAMRHEVGHLLA